MYTTLFYLIFQHYKSPINLGASTSFSPLFHFILANIDLSQNQSENEAVLKFVNQILQTDINCNAVDSEGRKASKLYPQETLALLCYACSKGSLNVVHKLITSGVSPNQCDKYGFSPLMYGTISGHRDVLLFLLEYGALVNFREGSMKNRTAFWLGCQNQQINCTNLLIEVGADINIPDETGISPLMLVAEQGNLNLTRKLLLNSANVNQHNSNGWNSVMTACYFQHTEVAFMLYQAGADVLTGSGEHNALHIAIQNNMVSLVNYITARNEKAFEYATNCIDIIAACEAGYQSLIERANKKQIKEAVKLSVEKGDIHTLQTLQQCSHNWKVNDTKEHKINTHTSLLAKQLIENIQNEPNEEKVVNMIKNGCYVNTKINGKTLLQTALMKKWHRLIATLCNNPELRINQLDDVGRTAIFYVRFCPQLETESGKLSTFHFLKEKGADVSVRDDLGQTMFHDLCFWPTNHNKSTQFHNIFPYLDMNWRDDNGLNALHLTLIKNDNHLKSKLLECGCDLDLKHMPHLQQQSFCSPDNDNNVTLLSQEEAEQNQPLSQYIMNLHKQSKMTTQQDKFDKHMRDLLVLRDEDFMEEFTQHKQEIESFWSKINSIIVERYPLFRFKMVLSGSCAEGTKIGEMDEVEVLFILEDPFWQQFKVSAYTGTDLTYVRLSHESPETQIDETIQQLFDGKWLSARLFLLTFYSIIRKVLAQVLRQFPRIYMLDMSHILSQGYSINDLHLVWSGKQLKWQPFSMDVVPQIPLHPSQVPKQLKHIDLTDDIYVVPKWDISLFEDEVETLCFRLGFSHSELDIFHAMGAALRHAYALNKSLIRNCVRIDSVSAGKYISSYLLKVMTFELFIEEQNEQKTKQLLEKVRSSVPHDAESKAQYLHLQAKKAPLHKDTKQNPNEVLRYSEQILDRLESNLINHNLESFFLPTANLIAHKKYLHDHRPQLYIQICKAIIADENHNIWQTLAETIAKWLSRPDRKTPNDRTVEEFKMLESLAGNTKSVHFGELAQVTARHLVSQPNIMQSSASITDLNLALKAAEDAMSDQSDSMTDTEENTDPKHETHSHTDSDLITEQTCDQSSAIPIRKQVSDVRNSVLVSLGALVEAGKITDNKLTPQLKEAVDKTLTEDKKRILDAWTGLADKAAKSIVTEDFLHKGNFTHNFSSVLKLCGRSSEETTKWREKAWGRLGKIMNHEIQASEVQEQLQEVVAKCMMPTYKGEMLAWSKLADDSAKKLIQRKKNEGSVLADGFSRLLDTFDPFEQVTEIVSVTEKTTRHLKELLPPQQIQEEDVEPYMEKVISLSMLPDEQDTLKAWQNLSTKMTEAAVKRLVTTHQTVNDFVKEFFTLREIGLDHRLMIDCLHEIHTLDDDKFREMMKESLRKSEHESFDKNLATEIIDQVLRLRPHLQGK